MENGTELCHILFSSWENKIWPFTPEYLCQKGTKKFRHLTNKIYFDSTKAKHEKLKSKENTSDVECRNKWTATGV